MNARTPWIALLLAPLPFLGADTVPPDAPLPPVGSPGGPDRVLSASEAQQWLRGRRLFDHSFHRSEGLGSNEFNADSCRACHQDPVLGGAGALELNVSRFGRDNLGLGPFQDLPGGQALSKLRPPYVAGREEYDESRADVFEQRQTPSLLGAGLLDSIPEAEILAHEDPSDADLDGVRGVARLLTIGGATEVGRFGWKAQVPNLRDFAKDALANEVGITTPDDGRGFARLTDVDATPDPEVDDARVDDLAFFMAHLAPPQRVGSLDPQVTAGELLFTQIGCAKCHRPELAGPGGPVPAFTDLLLHRVMPGGYRGMAEPGAGVGIFRTPPLWGVRTTAPYMHDGRAETLADAILAHFAEGLSAKNAFVALAQIDKDALLAFLNDL